jgi:hypothetical protein
MIEPLGRRGWDRSLSAFSPRPSVKGVGSPGATHTAAPTLVHGLLVHG